MEKKTYEEPTVAKVEFDFSNRIVASAPVPVACWDTPSPPGCGFQDVDEP